MRNLWCGTCRRRTSHRDIGTGWECAEHLTCEADSGSMTGNRPVCSLPATRQLAYVTPCYGTFTTRLCDSHARGLSARVWPDPVTSDERITR